MSMPAAADKIVIGLAWGQEDDSESAQGSKRNHREQRWKNRSGEMKLGDGHGL